MRSRTVAAFTMTLLAGLLVLFLWAPPSPAAELDDSGLYVEAFNAFQKRDYLLTIDKVNQLTQFFPESPLRDITLLLLARAGLKSGDNALAAKTINQFTSEFSDSPLKTSVEDELLTLVARHNKGEKLPFDKPLRTAAQKVRNDQLALERTIALKAEQERKAKEQAERDRAAREKAEAERKERERAAALKLAKEGIKLAIAVPSGNRQIEAGKNGQIPFEVINKGIKREEFLLLAPVPKEYAALLTSLEKPGEKLERITLAPGEKRKVNLTFRMPSDRVDGFKTPIQIQAVSAAYSDVAFSKEAIATAAAPLVRIVAKPHKTQVTRGETVKYRIAVLNAGSLAAQGLSVRVTIPPQLDFISAVGADYRQAAGIVTFRLDALETGRLAELGISATVRENVAEKQELRIQVEVINGQLQRKDIFTSSPAVVQAK